MKTLGAFLTISGIITLCPACVIEQPLRPVSERARAVRVERGDPPADAQLIGPISGRDGKGCGFDDARGTLRNATTAVQEAAAQRGADFVKITKETKPYSGRDCFHQEYALEGLAYRTRSAQPPAPPIAPIPVAAAVAPPSSASPDSASCAPPCSPGYACAAGVCVAQCNPACVAGEVCRADRVCVPLAAPGAGSGSD